MKYLVERSVRGKGVVRMDVDAHSGADAGRAADEIKYASEWERGYFRGDRTKNTRPEPWAVYAARDLGLAPRPERRADLKAAA
jgi:hypothetical protein